MWLVLLATTAAVMGGAGGAPLEGGQSLDGINSTGSYDGNMTEFNRIARNKIQAADNDHRSRDNWLQMIKDNVLRQIGRTNMTSTRNVNRTKHGGQFNDTIITDDQLTEKIRSFYPSCEMPPNTDQEAWNDDKIMNLFFNLNQGGNQKMANIGSATLRLYRNSSSENSTNPGFYCEDNTSYKEEKLLRVSIYWYTVPLRKKKIKRRLSDSIVIYENAKWVDLSVKPAARFWSDGTNLGLAVVIEDQDGEVLKATQYFKGALCMVGASTPKPIPTIVVDAYRHSDAAPLDPGLQRLLGDVAGLPFADRAPLLPTLDLCTVERPAPAPRPCAPTPPVRHLRHQRQHHLKAEQDPRESMVNARILSNEELQSLAAFNFTRR